MRYRFEAPPHHTLEIEGQVVHGGEEFEYTGDGTAAAGLANWVPVPPPEATQRDPERTLVPPVEKLFSIENGT